MPINCATAPGDLRVLNSEKASTASRIGNGVSMIAPIGLVAGLVTGSEKTKYEVTTGEYNKAPDTKIAHLMGARAPIVGPPDHFSQHRISAGID
jgi:hypothetical protein